MKITLISTGSKNDKGPQIMANFLEAKDHSVQVLFSNFLDEKDLLKKTKKSGLVVISANKETCSKASKLFTLLKPLDIPLAYAGVYPHDSPDECIKETDLVVVKNPKETLLELANRLENFQKINDIPNLWFKATEEELIKN
ncbi:MAG: hypothetical protein CMH63_00915 [Nanoarchaeota archaeon]|jgi:hypothetical protein|nr:hypothetical protein [Nanoarchaeota archaeon]|tara:strand:+ start:8570 stop:8992 length:423 start_codon:yes stop_codon:yes gene_type:complete